MRVKVTKVSEDSYWYRGQIGNEFEVEPDGTKGLEYVLLPREPHGDHYLMVEDCEIVED
jgi:hypothetical protein